MANQAKSVQRLFSILLSHPSAEITTSREQRVAQASQPDPSLPCHSLALDESKFNGYMHRYKYSVVQAGTGTWP